MSDKTITKRELVLKIAAETNLIQEDVFAVVQKTLDHITETLIQGDRVEFRDFGVFELCTRKAASDAIRISPPTSCKFRNGAL